MALDSKSKASVIMDARQDKIYIQDFFDGNALNKPKIINTQNADFSIDAIINADDKNIDLFKNVNVPKCTLPNAIARLAINIIGSENSLPAPMYLQEPNADLPKEQPPKLI